MNQIRTWKFWIAAGLLVLYISLGPLISFFLYGDLRIAAPAALMITTIGMLLNFRAFKKR